MKVCFKCGAEKPLSSFYKHSKASDGHLNKCKECTKKDNRENRNKKIDYYREYDKQRANNPERVAARDKYAKSDEGKAIATKAKKKYIENNPKKRAVHIKVGNAIRAGLLNRQPCSVCGNIDSVAHHCDYDKPFDITWLCPAHHAEWHKINGEGLNPF